MENNEQLIPQQEIQSPVQPRLWPLDQQLRREAMDNAIIMSNQWTERHRLDYKQIVEAADGFYKFLKGDQTPEANDAEQ